MEILSAASLAGKPVPRQRWHVPNLIPAGNVTLLSGDGATGKSLLALHLAVATATAGDWIGFAPEPGVAVYVSAEDELDELHRRLAAIEADLSKLTDLHLVPLAGKDAVLAAPDGREGLLKTTPVFKALKRIVEKYRPTLLVLDTLADLFGGDEVKKVHARQFIGLLRGLGIEFETTILLLSHPSLSGMQSGSGMSGNVGWSNGVRSRLYFERIKDPDGSEEDADMRMLRTKKANRARGADTITIRYREGKFVSENVSRNNLKAERLFLELLKRLSDEDRPVSPNRSNNYAPQIFSEHPDGAGIKKAAFATAMDELLKQGRIQICEDGPPSKRRRHLVLVDNGRASYSMRTEANDE
ncbi:MAG: AAA family ATPase [Xanthobacteraceae bacterium]